jgi:hypothetical protein
MGNNSTNKHILQKILQSPGFVNSKIDRDLLSYLLKATKQEISLKESTIAGELFDRESDFNPAEDTIVRVHMHNLRKKLSLFYLSEGKNDKIQLCIPKGSYEVKFVGKKTREKIISKIKFKSIYLLTFIIAFLVVLSIYQWRENTLLKETAHIGIKNESNSFWSDYLQSEDPILFVFGELYILWEYKHDIEDGRLIHDSNINTAQNLVDFNTQHGNDNINLVKAHESFFNEHQLFSIFNICPVLIDNSIKPEYTLTSYLDWHDIADNNIIFIGEFRTSARLKRFFSKSSFAFNLNPRQLYYLDKNSDTLKTYSTEYKSGDISDVDSYRYYIKDYPVIVKIPGPNNLPILFFSGFFDVGIKETIRHLTIPLLSNKLEKMFVEKYGYIPKYFEILFEVEGYEKTKISAKILLFNEIK